ncbi:hypothetical protein CLOSYM_02888 [[Clostridium] symbiosum ATCC 14940]|uniref:Uncharacterized protein n=1 Tax=[Clostridium] symbiosum ATCC 14940 TaxID=411472 RepID=A0ABC9TW30_CLOSY|nr:hypothetical protein CLOSYM_02888 [[Clostridium] symbiosum ATCC 14940]
MQYTEQLPFCIFYGSNGEIDAFPAFYRRFTGGSGRAGRIFRLLCLTFFCGCLPFCRFIRLMPFPGGCIAWVKSF